MKFCQLKNVCSSIVPADVEFNWRGHRTQFGVICCERVWFSARPSTLKKINLKLRKFLKRVAEKIWTRIKFLLWCFFRVTLRCWVVEDRLTLMIFFFIFRRKLLAVNVINPVFTFKPAETRDFSKIIHEYHTTKTLFIHATASRYKQMVSSTLLKLSTLLSNEVISKLHFFLKKIRNLAVTLSCNNLCLFKSFSRHIAQFLFLTFKWFSVWVFAREWNTFLRNFLDEITSITRK